MTLSSLIAILLTNAAAATLLALVAAGGGRWLREPRLVHGLWIVVLLKALNGILVPLAFKYADNMIYQYAKQASIVLSVVVTSIVARVFPSAAFLCGAGVVLISMVAY